MMVNEFASRRRFCSRGALALSCNVQIINSDSFKVELLAWIVLSNCAIVWQNHYIYLRRKYDNNGRIFKIT